MNRHLDPEDWGKLPITIDEKALRVVLRKALQPLYDAPYAASVMERRLERKIDKIIEDCHEYKNY